MTVIEMIKLSDKLSKMSREEIRKMLDSHCNKCVIKHLGRTPCDKRECSFEKLCIEEIKFRSEMTKLVK